MSAYEKLISAWDYNVARNLVETACGMNEEDFYDMEGEGNNTLATFVKKYCTACSGDWGQMLLSGIKKLWPEVYDAIPDDMGVFAIEGLMSTLILCGVEVENND